MFPLTWVGQFIVCDGSVQLINSRRSAGFCRHTDILHIHVDGLQIRRSVGHTARCLGTSGPNWVALSFSERPECQLVSVQLLWCCQRLLSTSVAFIYERAGKNTCVVSSCQTMDWKQSHQHHLQDILLWQSVTCIIFFIFSPKGSAHYHPTFCPSTLN